MANFKERNDFQSNSKIYLYRVGNFARVKLAFSNYGEVLLSRRFFRKVADLHSSMKR